MKILLALLQFKNLTGSELYVYDLSKELVKRGHDVTIGYLYGGNGEIVTRSKNNGVKVKNLLKIKGRFDIINTNQTQATGVACKLFKAPIIQTLHSEIIDEYESPVVSDQVKHYICIRSSIMEKFKAGIPAKKMTVIYNGVDLDRFRMTSLPTGNNRYLFVGTHDHLREKSALDLVNNLKVGETVTFMGQGWEIGENVVHPQVRFIGPQWNVEDEISKCNIVVGVMMGRTTIEGWMMNRKALIYDVDKEGNILSKSMFKRPKYYMKFRLHYMVDRVLKVYKKVLNGKNS